MSMHFLILFGFEVKQVLVFNLTIQQLNVHCFKHVLTSSFLRYLKLILRHFDHKWGLKYAEFIFALCMSHILKQNELNHVLNLQHTQKWVGPNFVFVFFLFIENVFKIRCNSELCIP